jgi:hypothetical protein
MLLLLLLLPRCKTDDVSVALKKKHSFGETSVSSGDTPSQGFARRRHNALHCIAAVAAAAAAPDVTRLRGQTSLLPFYLRGQILFVRCFESSKTLPSKMRIQRFILQPSTESGFAGVRVGDWERITSGDG